MSQSKARLPDSLARSDDWQDALFTQSPPTLGNQFAEDPLLGSWLARSLPESLLDAGLREELRELGGLAGGELYRLQLADRLNEPELTQWDAWGRRVDEVVVTRLWSEAEKLAAKHGLVATGYDRTLGRYARLAQFLKVYLFHPSSDVYTCPLAMTDGAVRCLLASGSPELQARAIPHLTSRELSTFWTSGQWMTETTGGSDVGRSETRAVQQGGDWRLYGRKWFTSAVTSQMALTLARPEGNPPGGKGLAMFYVEVRDAEGRLNGLRVDRLKDKLGTRKVPTAELFLEGAHASLVGPPLNGTRSIEPMLAVTRMWNSVCAIAFMRRGLALARSYAKHRKAFGQPLERLPLHVDTLAGLEAETWGAFLMTFLLVELNGRQEAGEIDEGQRALLRLLTPLTKLVTGKQAVAVVTEVIESFGGAGYVEDTGLPQLLRDTHVLPIWEGTTNVLSLDALLRSDLHAGLAALMGRASACVRNVHEPRLAAAARQALGALERAVLMLESCHDQEVLQAGARRLALTLSRALQLTLLCEHAQWMLDHGGDRRGYAAALRFACQPVDLITEVDPEADRLLLG
ncbi:MAG TPA: acyl-CoA dehydrogenase family protein [Steroidobacteraceae bacterium]|nr:acyl-CoA dehydrogenase family protein [Steroidobacteraceae bacterium]